MIFNDLDEHFEELTNTARILKVIAHPVRLQIIESLGNQGALSVSEIMEALNSSIEQSMLSHHLIKLKENGVLVSKKKGKFNYYSLKDKKLLILFNIK